VLSPEIRGHLDQRWIDSLEFSAAASLCDKAYAGPLRAGEAEIRNSIDRLIFTWDANHCDTLGIWLTRGGWNGHHHIALEPANGAPDSLAVAAGEWKRCGVVPAFGRKSWSVKIRVLPASTLETSGEAGLEETPPAKTGGRKPLQDALQGGL
jgi:hypothetical protein